MRNFLGTGKKMKLQITKDQLIGPISRVLGAVDRKNTLPVLQCILIQGEPAGITITSTDLQMQMITHTDIASEPFGLCVNARKIMDILKSLPDQSTLTIEITESAIILRCGHARFRIATISADNFPVMNAGGSGAEFSVDAADLRRALKMAVPCMGKDDVRACLNGINIRMNGGTFTATASDGHRLATCRLSVETGQDLNIILPRKSTLELIKLLPEDGAISAVVNDRSITFDMPSIRVSSRLIEGRFPDVARLIPEQYDAEFVMDRDKLRDAIARVSRIAGDTTECVILSLSNGDLNLQVSTYNEESSDMLPVDCRESLKIAFNYQYLLEILSAMESRDIRISLNAEKPSLLRDAKSGDYLFILMPMRI